MADNNPLINFNPNHQDGYPSQYNPDPTRYSTVMQPSEYSIAQQHHQQYIPLPSDMGIQQGSSDIDSLLQTHRLNMFRRAANRRSAQQSRARKKVHFQYYLI
jgi:hypothetical protein